MARPQHALDGDASPLVSRSEGLPSETACNIYTTRPSDIVIDRFLAHVRETGQPETFPTLCREPPLADSPPKFLRKFDVDRKLRPERDMAPCAICSPWNPKFLHDGFLVWYPQEAVIRAIGPECGDAIFGGTAYAEAFADFTREERERTAVEFLERNLRKVLEMVVALERIRPAAKEGNALHYTLRTRAPRIHGELRRIKATGGALKVTIVIDKTEEDENRIDGPRGFGKADSEYDTHDVMFGHLPNTTMLLKQFDPLAQVRAIQDILIGLPRFDSDENAFLWICDQSPDLEKLEAVCADLRECSRLYLKLDVDLRRTTAFFSGAVFDALHRWGRHEANRFNLKATVVSGTYTIAHIDEQRCSESVELVPDFSALAARGDWPGFE